MNNLTPLQEVAATLMAGMLSGLYADTTVISVDFKAVRQTALDQAKALLEATKPEPLEWKEYPHPLEGFSSTWYSKAGEFKIVYGGKEKYLLCDLANSITEDRIWYYANSVDEAKQFAEHIRTR
jgi:hypothetical protein